MNAASMSRVVSARLSISSSITSACYIYLHACPPELHLQHSAFSLLRQLLGLPTTTLLTQTNPQPTLTMPDFHASAEDMSLDNHTLKARLRDGNGEWRDAEINLNDFLGNEDGHFFWGGNSMPVPLSRLPRKTIANNTCRLLGIRSRHLTQHRGCRRPCPARTTYYRDWRDSSSRRQPR
jgi:hypothetical protein